MAKTISDEKIKFSIVIDGNSAQKELLDLDKNTRELTKSNKDLLAQKKTLEAQGRKESVEYKNLTAEIKANSLAITANKTKMNELQEQIGLTGLTMKQLSDKATGLRMALRNAIPGTEAYRQYHAELHQVNGRLGELSGRSQQAGSSISNLADRFNRYQGIAVASIATLTGLVLSVQEIIDINGKLSDAQSDVMKTTGMTKDEVDELTKSFGMLETRTSRIDLLGIAEQGGRIGIAKNEIGDFVNVMNKASVALGDSFTGGAEEVSNKLGKIKFLFQETKDLNVDQAYNSIGSAINDLGANGVASEANVAEFTTRIGSLTDVLKPSIQETLALGAAFEESGIEAEVSSRAYNIFMKQASTESSKFAQVMGISKKSVEDMINTNPLEFMLKFSEGMKGMDATETAKTLEFLGINADGANKVIGAMGNNTARFRELMELSNKSFADGTSLVNEYNVKNNNLASTLEKIKKTVTGWFSSETFTAWLTSAVNWIAKMINATEDADGSASKWKNTLLFTFKVIGILTAALITNVAWYQISYAWINRNKEATLLYNVAVKAKAFAEGVSMIASQAYAAVTMLLTGNIKGATQAFRVMTATMKTTPWGFILGAVSAVVAAYVMFRDTADEAAEKQKMFADIHLEATKSISKQKTELETLTKVAQDQNQTEEVRMQALAKLNDMIPDHIGLLTMENIATAEGTAILKKYTDELYKNARAKAVQKKFDELADKKLEAENKTAGSYRKDQTFGFLGSSEFDNVKSRQELEAAIAKKYKGTTAEWQKMLADKVMGGSGLADKYAEIKGIEAQMKALEKELVSGTVNDLKNPDNNTPQSNYNVPTEGDKDKKEKKDPNSNDKEIKKLIFDDQAKYNEMLLKQQRQFEDDRIAAMQDGYEKELALENLRYQREIEDLQKQKVHDDEIVKQDEDIAKAKEAKDVKKYNALLEIKKGWKEKNAKIDEQVNEIIEGKLAIHNLKVATIEEKAATKSIQDLNDQYQKEKALRETAFLDEINDISSLSEAKARLKEMGYKGSLYEIETLNQAKEALQKQYNIQELANEEQHLREVLDQFERIVKKDGGGVFDLSLLTPEQVADFEKKAAEVGLSLQQLIDKRNELKGQPDAGDKQATEAVQAMGNSADIFGFTNEQWQQAFDSLDTVHEKIQAAVMVSQALINAWGMYNHFLEQNEKKQMATFEQNTNSKKKRLKQQLDAGIINQDQYNRSVEKADQDLAKKKAEMEYKQAKRQKAIAMANIAMNTAQAIMGIWAQVPKFDFGISAGVMTGIVGALGALQMAMVANEPLPSATGYEEGLYNTRNIRREQDGKVFKSRYMGKTRSGLVKDTSHFLVAESGPEMIIDNKAWTKMDPQLKDALIRELSGIKGFENGFYNDNLKRYEVPASSGGGSSENSQMLIMMMNLIAENTAVLKDLKENGFVGHISNKDYVSMKNIKEGLKRYESLRNDNKQK